MVRNILQKTHKIPNHHLFIFQLKDEKSSVRNIAVDFSQNFCSDVKVISIEVWLLFFIPMMLCEAYPKFKGSETPRKRPIECPSSEFSRWVKSWCNLAQHWSSEGYEKSLTHKLTIRPKKCPINDSCQLCIKLAHQPDISIDQPCIIYFDSQYN